jgi:microcompartment protein CcmL/EutN
MQPAVVLFEFDSIAVGIEAGDAMVKRSPLATLHVGTVQPGKFLVLAGGDVASVEEALTAGRTVGAGSLVDEIYLPDVHEDVVTALTGGRRSTDLEALGVVETRTVAAVIGAADAGVKEADVTLLEIRLADGLGGKAYALFSGVLAEVQAAVEAAEESLSDRRLLVGRVVVPRIHPEMLENLLAHPEFGMRVRSVAAGSESPSRRRSG